MKRHSTLTIIVLSVASVIYSWSGLGITWARERDLGSVRSQNGINSSHLLERYLLEQDEYYVILNSKSRLYFKKKKKMATGAKKGKQDILLDQAVELFAQRDFLKAEDKLREVLKLDQRNVEALNWLARIRLAPGYHQEAFDILQKALSLDPNNIDALNGKAVIYIRQQRFDKALPLLKKALKLAPNHYQTLVNIGAFYSEIGEINKAILHLNKAMEIEPDNHDAYFNLSILYWKLGELNEAKRLLEKVLVYEPKNLWAHHLLSSLALQEKRYLDFIEHQQMILKLGPQLANKIFLNIARAFALNKQFDQAIEYGKNSIKIFFITISSSLLIFLRYFCSSHWSKGKIGRNKEEFREKTGEGSRGSLCKK